MSGFRRKPPPSLFGDAVVGIFLDLERGAQKAELVLQVDIGLEGAEIGERLRIAKIILVGEGPGIEQLGLLLCHLRQQRDRLGVMRRIEQVLQRVQIVLHEIDHRIAIALRNGSRATRTIIWLRPIASSCVNSGCAKASNSGSVPNGKGEVIRSTLPSFSMAFWSGKRTSIIVTSRLSCRLCFASIARTAMSTALPRWLVAMILPLRSSTAWIGLSLRTK